MTQAERFCWEGSWRLAHAIKISNHFHESEQHRSEALEILQQIPFLSRKSQLIVAGPVTGARAVGNDVADSSVGNRIGHHMHIFTRLISWLVSLEGPFSLVGNPRNDE